MEIKISAATCTHAITVIAVTTSAVARFLSASAREEKARGETWIDFQAESRRNGE